MTDYYNPLAEALKELKPMKKITIEISEDETSLKVNALLNVVFNQLFKHGASNMISDQRDRFEGYVTLYGISKKGEKFLSENEK